MKRGDTATLTFFIYGEASQLGAKVEPRMVEPRQAMDVPNTIGPYQAAERIAKLYTDYLTSEEGRERRPFVVVDCGSVSRKLAGETYGMDRAVYLARIRQRRTRKVLIVLFWLESSQDAPSAPAEPDLASRQLARRQLDSGLMTRSQYDAFVTPADTRSTATKLALEVRDLLQWFEYARDGQSFATIHAAGLDTLRAALKADGIDVPTTAPIVEPTAVHAAGAALYDEMVSRLGAPRVAELLKTANEANAVSAMQVAAKCTPAMALVSRAKLDDLQRAIDEMTDREKTFNDTDDDGQTYAERVIDCASDLLLYDRKG